MNEETELNFEEEEPKENSYKLTLEEQYYQDARRESKIYTYAMMMEDIQCIHLVI